MSMSSITHEISKLIEEKTFTADAIEGIKLVRDRVRKQEDEIIKKDSQIAELNLDLSRHRTIVADMNKRDNDVTTRENAVAEREKKMSELELRAAVAIAEQNVLSRFVDKMLANRTMRETITSSVPIERQYGNNSGSTIEHHTKTDMVTKEEA